MPAAGDIEVLAADALLGDGGYHQVELLFTAARKVAVMFGADNDRLLWLTDRAYFEQIARRHGFDDLQPRRRGQGASKHQLEARF